MNPDGIVDPNTLATSDTTAEGLSYMSADLVTGGLVSALSDVATVAQAASQTALSVRQSAAVAGQPVSATPSFLANATPTEKAMLLLGVAALVFGMYSHHSRAAL